jgi:hypothetical protein
MSAKSIFRQLLLSFPGPEEDVTDLDLGENVRAIEPKQLLPLNHVAPIDQMKLEIN